MRRMKRMMAVTILAAMATLSAQTAFASSGVILSDVNSTSHRDGVLLSDKDGVLLSDKSSDTLTNGVETWDGLIISVITGLTGVLLGD